MDKINNKRGLRADLKVLYYAMNTSKEDLEELYNDKFKELIDKTNSIITLQAELDYIDREILRAKTNYCETDIGETFKFIDEYGECVSVMLTKNNNDKFDLVLLSNWKNRKLKPYYVFGYNCLFKSTVTEQFTTDYNLVLIGFDLKKYKE